MSSDYTMRYLAKYARGHAIGKAKLEELENSGLVHKGVVTGEGLAQLHEWFAADTQPAEQSEPVEEN